MIKMVVSSFYNTLINEEEAIASSTMLEIDRLRNKGIIFCVCTNRLSQEILDYNRDLPFIDYIISLNGNCIYEVESGKYFSKNKLSCSNIKKVSTIFKDSKIYYYTEKNVYEKLDDILEEDIYKIEVEIEEDKEREKLGKLNVNSSIFTWQGKKYLEIVSSRSSMFSGVDQVSLKLDISLNEIVSIGANESDYSLIKNIEKSYIMKNSCPILKKVTKRVTKSNNEKGVEMVLKKL